MGVPYSHGPVGDGGGPLQLGLCPLLCLGGLQGVWGTHILGGGGL